MKIYILLINVIVAYACTTTRPQEEVLSKSDMIALLIDTHLLEGKIEKLNLKRDSAAMVFNTLQLDLLKEHKIEKEFYEKSFVHYLDNVKQMDEIYAIVVDSLNVIQKRGYISEEEDGQTSLSDSTRAEILAKKQKKIKSRSDSVRTLK